MSSEHIAELERQLADARAELRRQREAERFLESIVENLPDSIFVKDAEHLRFERVNSACERLIGLPRADLLGKGDHDFFPQSEADFFVANDRRVLDDGELLDIPEEPIHTASGPRTLHTKKIPIRGDDGAPRFLLGISRDITERKEAERALAGAEARVRDRDRRLGAVLEQFPGVTWTTDADLRVTSTAGARAALLGLAAEEVLGRPVAEVVPAGPGIDLDALHRTALAGGASRWEFRASGATYEVIVRRLGDDEAGGLVAIALDVTERRREEEERLRARLARTQRLELLGLLAGGIAHDFNNLLTAVLGNASLAIARLPDDSLARAPLERVERSAKAATDLTRQLLAYSGKGRFVIEPIDLSRVIEEIGGLLRVTIPRGISLEFALAPDLPRCEADAAQIRQVVLNLITNAADAIGERTGRIVLATGVIEADRAYLRSAWLDEELPEGRYVWLEVGDDGVGMDAETQNHMFDPFFTTKDTGHGLGLSATLGIVRGHCGAIRVYTERGRGTTIKVLLPALATATSSARERPPSAAAPVASGTVLVVDDERAIRELASDTLSSAGFRVVCAVDGVDALEQVRAGLSIDVVLLDMTMPRMGGEECFRELRRVRPGLPVVLSSGYNEQDATNRFAGKGLAGFLQKPYTAQGLVAAIRAAGSRVPSRD